MGLIGKDNNGSGNLGLSRNFARAIKSGGGKFWVVRLSYQFTVYHTSQEAILVTIRISYYDLRPK